MKGLEYNITDTQAMELAEQGASQRSYGLKDALNKGIAYTTMLTLPFLGGCIGTINGVDVAHPEKANRMYADSGMIATDAYVQNGSWCERNPKTCLTAKVVGGIVVVGGIAYIATKGGSSSSSNTIAPVVTPPTDGGTTPPAGGGTDPNNPNDGQTGGI